MKPINTKPDPAERIEHGRQEFKAPVQIYGVGPTASTAPQAKLEDNPE